ncbi:alpha/beta fold hydrolase [Kouleothrix sp.]|uniref:alpha/beta fold hydrolase n=1 Tax=Kouleothrix sp. TaxID=2779161 RepID=UPI00391D8DDE
MTRPDTMPPPPELQPYARSVQAGGLRLHVYDTGPRDGLPVLLVHGLGDEADTWRHILPALARHRRVIAFDLPGFGRSQHPRRAYTGAFFASTAANLLGALDIRRAALVGHSMGAAIVQRLALAAPALADRLILIGGGLPVAASRPPAQLWLFLAPGLGEALYTSLRRSQAEAYATLRPYYANLEGLPEADQAFLRQRVWARVWSSGQRRAFFSALRWMAADQAVRAQGFRARLAAAPTPTRLIWGERDQIVPRALGDTLAQLVPGARLDAVPESGHLPHQEQPARVLELLEEALTK